MLVMAYLVMAYAGVDRKPRAGRRAATVVQREGSSTEAGGGCSGVAGAYIVMALSSYIVMAYIVMAALKLAEDVQASLEPM